MSAAAMDEFDGVPSDAELVQRWAERSASAGVFDIACSPEEWHAVVGALSSAGWIRPAPVCHGAVVAVYVGSAVVSFRPPG